MRTWPSANLVMMAVKQDEERLRELACGTLPFTLCPSLLDELRKSLTAAGNRMTPPVRKRVSAGISGVLRQFVSGALDGAQVIEPSVRKKAAAILRRELRIALRAPQSGSSANCVDHLSVTDRGRLASWVESAVRDAAPESRRIGQRLEKATRRLQQIEVALAQAPTEDELRLTMAKMNDAHKNLGAAQQEARALDEELNRVQRELKDIDRQLKRLSGKVEEGEKAERARCHRQTVAGRPQAVSGRCHGIKTTTT